MEVDAAGLGAAGQQSRYAMDVVQAGRAVAGRQSVAAAPGVGMDTAAAARALIAVLLDDGRQHCTTRTDELFGRPTQRSCRRLNAWWLAA